MSDIVLPAKKAELGNLLNTFFKSYAVSPEGEKHLTLYERGGKEGHKHYTDLVAASARGEDVTDMEEVRSTFLGRSNNGQ